MPPSPPLPKLIKLSLVRTYAKITSAPFTMHVMKSHSIDFNFNLNFNRVGMSQGLAQCYEKPINVFTYVQFRRLFYVSPRNDSFSSGFFLLLRWNFLYIVFRIYSSCLTPFIEIDTQHFEKGNESHVM